MEPPFGKMPKPVVAFKVSAVWNDVMQRSKYSSKWHWRDESGTLEIYVENIDSSVNTH